MVRLHRPRQFRFDKMRNRIQIRGVLAGVATRREFSLWSQVHFKASLRKTRKGLCARAVAIPERSLAFSASTTEYAMADNYAGFVKMMRTDDITELISTHPLAYVLASVIALRARFQPGQSMIGLNPGEAFIGDHKACGISRQQYRTAKAKLVALGFVTFKSTNKGTIAKLTDARLFDVLNIAGNHPNNHQTTSEQPLTNNGNTGKTENNTETGVLQHLCVSEIVAYALARSNANFSAASVKTWIDNQDFDNPAYEIIDSIQREDGKEAIRWAFRFIHYNNLHGWPLIHSWKSALVGFCEKCDHGSGPADVPQDWIPKILTPKLYNA